jgi:hypothetical protein
MAAVEGNMKEIERKAYERYILDLLKGCAAEEERLQKENRGREFNILIRQIDLVGEYPYVAFDIHRYHRISDRESVFHATLYQTPGWFDKDGKRLVDTDQIVADTLISARGG